MRQRATAILMSNRPMIRRNPDRSGINREGGIRGSFWIPFFYVWLGLNLASSFVMRAVIVCRGDGNCAISWLFCWVCSFRTAESRESGQAVG